MPVVNCLHSLRCRGRRRIISLHFLSCRMRKLRLNMNKDTGKQRGQPSEPWVGRAAFVRQSKSGLSNPGKAQATSADQAGQASGDGPSEQEEAAAGQSSEKEGHGRDVQAMISTSTSLGKTHDKFPLAVCGLHLRGQPLCHQLEDLGARFLKTCRSSPDYRLFAITDYNTGKTKPGMVAVVDGSGAAIELELWELPTDKVGFLMQLVSAPLGIGTVRLDDGTTCKGFNCEGFVLEGGAGIEDITSWGGWLAWLEYKKSRDQEQQERRAAIDNWVSTTSAGGPPSS